MIPRLESLLEQSQSGAVWPDLVKFHHFGKNLQIVSKMLTVYFLFGKMLSRFGKFVTLLDKFLLLQMAKYWKIIEPSGHTDPQITKEARGSCSAKYVRK